MGWSWAPTIGQTITTIFMRVASQRLQEKGLRCNMCKVSVPAGCEVSS